MSRSVLLLVFAVSIALTSATPLQAVVEENQPKAAVFRFMSAERDQVFRDCLPRVEDPAMQAILDDPRLILYTDREMPPAYQQWRGDLQGVHSPSYNISAAGNEPFGNGNREFPWGHPAGTHRTSNVRSFRFLWLPEDGEGKPLPVVWFRRRLSGDTSQGYAWRFPVGTIFGEVLMMHGPDGRDYTFEMRVRIREAGDWAVDVFRPFPTAEHLADRIRELQPKWREQPHLTKLVAHLQQPVKMAKFTLVDHQPGRRTFHASMGTDVLPPVGDDRLVGKLLVETTFKSALGETWRYTGDGQSTCAPTTKANFHIVPAKYDAGFIEVDRSSCIRCHNTVNQHVSRFNFSRDWYGRIRGSDGIFSFHPFDPGTISYNGFGQPVRMRAKLTQAGLLVKYESSKHPRSLYTQVPHLRE